MKAKDFRALLAQRNKYHAQPTCVEGHRFASKTEADYGIYLWGLLRAGAILHVDVHPVLTLGHGDRVRLDFLVWWPDGRVEGVDVKGAKRTRAASEFRRLAKRWNHPTVTLRAVCRAGRKGWQEWE